MITLAVDTNSPNQTGFIPDVKSGGTGSVGEYFSQDSSMSLWIRPVVSSTANPLVPWVDDWVSADIYYLSIGAVDDRPTGGTFTLTLTGAIAAQSYNVTAAALTTALSARSVTDGYGALTVTLLSEGVYQVDWSTMIAVPAMTASATLLTPDSQITITQVRAGSGSTYAQQIIDIKQSAVASATISTAYATTDASATQITPPTDEYNSVWVVSFGSVFNGYVILTIRANGVFSAVNVSPFMSASDFGNALALHPEIYYQDPVQPDNISIDLVDGEFSIAFIGTLAGSATVRTISNISVAAAAVVTTSAAHGYVTGDSVVISGTNSTPVIDGTRLVTRLSATTFSVPVTTTVSGSAGSVYNTSQPDVSSDSSFAVFPKGNTGTLNLNTFALAKAFWSTTEDELTYSLQIKRVRASGESKTIFGEDIILKRELIDIGSLITIPTTGLTTLTLGAAGVATGTLNIAGTTSGTVTVTTAAAAGTWTLTLPANDGTANQVLTTDGNGVTSWATNGTGTVSSVSFTGGLISVATATTTPALTVAGTSGGIPYFSSGTTWATSAALAANSLVKGGGAGVAPSTITTGTGVLTALGVTTNAAGGFTTTDGTATLTNKTISGASNTITNVSLTTGVTGTLPIANGGTNATTAKAAIANLGLTQPTAFAGLALWMDASTLKTQGTAEMADGTAIDTWRSRAKLPFNSAEPAFTATTTARPLYKQSVQNSLPGVLFDGTNDLMTGPTDWTNLTGRNERTIFVVCKPTALVSTGSGVTYSRPNLIGTAAGYDGISISPSGSDNIFTAFDYDAASVRTASTGVLSVNSMALIESWHQDGVLSVSLNEAAAVTTTLREVTLSGSTIQMGTSGSAAFYTGYIFEVLIYSRVLGTIERDAVAAYLRAKWNF